MSEPIFPRRIDYEALKLEYGESDDVKTTHPTTIDDHALCFSSNTEKVTAKPLTGSRLRSYAFAVLTRKEYSKADLIEKLALYALCRDEVITLVEELARENYQSDQRLAELLLSSQKRQGKGPQRIKMALKNKKIDSTLITEELKETDWVAQAYALKVKKFGEEVSKEPKIQAKQIRFLMYRGFEMDTILKAIRRRVTDDE